MSNNNNNERQSLGFDSLGAGADDKKKGDSKRKMTAAILEDQEKQKETYEFLEEDDDFEEFEVNYEGTGVDVPMGGVTGAEDKQLWRTDWDDEEADDNFEQQLRAQLKMANTSNKNAASLLSK